jgi:hypothetical protein
MFHRYLKEPSRKKSNKIIYRDVEGYQLLVNRNRDQILRDFDNRRLELWIKVLLSDKYSNPVDEVLHESANRKNVNAHDA